jgi:hypothetical protein
MSIDLEQNLTPIYRGYHTLPKAIGSVAPHELLEIAKSNTKQAEEFNNSASVELRAVAGSALIEAALVAHNQDSESLETHLDYLNEAEYDLRIAAMGEYALLESGFTDPDNQASWQRAEINLDFMNVYRDIVRGKVTEQTKHEIITKLNKRLAYGIQLTKMKSGRGSKGVTHEITALLSFWQRYKSHEDPIAFPSTKRGGSGKFNAPDTHDIVVASQHGDQWNFEGIEVKGGEGLTEESLTRYRHPIMHIDNDGNIRMINGMAA